MGKTAGGMQWYEKTLLLIMNYGMSTHIHTRTHTFTVRMHAINKKYINNGLKYGCGPKRLNLT